MPRYIAFLRAINVGGHVVSMERLRQEFEALGFSHVETFIASGNIVFESNVKDTKAVEKRSRVNWKKNSDTRSRRSFGQAELAAIAKYKPSTKGRLGSAVALNVAFLSDALDAESKKKLMARRTDIDEFNVHGREVCWLPRKKPSESTFSNAALEKTIGKQSTLRGLNTVKKMAAKYPPRGCDWFCTVSDKYEMDGINSICISKIT